MLEDDFDVAYKFHAETVMCSTGKLHGKEACLPAPNETSAVFRRGLAARADALRVRFKDSTPADSNKEARKPKPWSL